MRSFKRLRPTSSRTTARITRYFWLLVAVICSLFLQAYMHNFNIVYVSLFFLVGFGLVSEFMGRGNLSRLDASVLGTGRFFANREAAYTLRVVNGSDVPSYAVGVDNGTTRGELSRIGAHGAEIVPMHVRFGRRGTAQVPPTELVSFYPLPHLRFGKTLTHGGEVTVYPEPVGVPLADMLARNRALTGERDDFDGVRRYESGDTASLIFWPSVARGETVMSKYFLYDEPSRRLQFDFASAADDDEARLSQLTLWVLECEKGGLDFEVRMPSELLDSRQRGIDAILETLARY